MFKLARKISISFLTLMVTLTILPTTALAANTETKIIDDIDENVVYSAGDANNGGWENWGSANHEETEHWSNSAGATVTIPFNGTKLELYGKKDVSHAKFSVSIDGATATVHDEYAAVKEMNALIFESSELTAGNHTAVVTVLGERNEASTGTGSTYGFQFSYAKAFNSAIIEPEAPEEPGTETVVTEVDNVDTGAGVNQFEFTGAWTSDGNPVAQNGTEHWTNKGKWLEELPSVTIKFKGNKIELFGQKEKTGAIYEATLDGVSVGNVDTYSVLKQPKERLYEKEGLSEGEHTLTLQVIRDFNATAGSSYDAEDVSAVIDYALVTSLETVTVDKTYETKVDNKDTTTGDEMFKYKFEGYEWTQGTGSSAFYKGTEAYVGSDNASKASYSVKFIGSGVKVISSKNTGHADYDVFIDGVKVGEAPAKLASGDPQHQKLLFERMDLEEGEHTLKVAVKSGSAGAIQADAVFITHKAIAPTSIAMDKEALSVEAGMSGKVTATMTPSYATGSIIYSVDKTDIATISNTGEVTGIKAGNATITASVKGTSVSASIPLTITPEGLPLAISVGDANMLVTQDHFEKVLTQAKTTWTDVAWRGDVLNSKVDLATRRASNNVTIKASNFTSGGNTIASSNVEVSWLRETLANIGRGNSGAPVKAFPDIIYNSASEALNIDARRVQSAWININVPEDAKPGVYRGTITVAADGMESASVLDYTFEVLDIVQPDPKEMDTQVQIWQHPFAVANYYEVDEADYFEEAHLKYMRESMKEYASLGGKDVVANIVNEAWGHQSYYGDPTMVQWIKKSDGTMAFNYDWFDKWITFNIESGVLDPEKGIGQIKCFSIVPWDDSFYYLDESTGKMVKTPSNAGSEMWVSMWDSFLTDFMKHVEEKGWFDITYIALDERPMNRVGPAVDLIKSIENADGKPFKISSAFNYESGSDYSFLDKIDDISIGLSHVNDSMDDMKKMAAHRKEKGLLTTIYTCTGDYPGNFTISDPVDNAWCMWYTMTQNTDGYMKWAWDNWVPDPLTNVTYKYWEPGDGWFIYPTEKGQESDTYFYKTPRYEMLKQGTRDINKAKYLMENSTELSSEVDTLVKSLKRPVPGGNGYGSAVPKTEADRQLAGSEVTRMREGINEITRKYVEATKPADVPVSSITVNKETVTLEVGATETITTTVLPTNATNQTLTWTSSDELVATVSNGVIKAVKAGKATILVTNADGKVSASINVVVKAEPVSPEVPEVPEVPEIPEVPEVPEETLKDTIVESMNQAATILGKLPEGVVLYANEVKDALKDALVKAMISKNIEFMKNKEVEQIFDLHMMLNNVIYQPNGEMKVKLKLTSDLQKKKLQILYVKDDGTIEVIPSSLEDDCIAFVTDHFSYYAIVSEKSNTISTDPIKNTGAITSQENGGQSPLAATGITIGCIVACLFIIKLNHKDTWEKLKKHTYS